MTVAKGDQPAVKITYSHLLRALKDGQVREMTLYPREDLVQAQLKDGRTARVAVFSNDPQIPRVAEAAGVPFTVRYDPEEGAMAAVLTNALLGVLLIGLLVLLLRRSASVAQKALGFGRSQARLQPEGSLAVRFEDVAGIDEAKIELQEVVAFLKEPKRFTTIGARIPRGVLLVGPPGTGKTLLARAIAGEAGVPFFSISASEFVEMFVGVGASRVRDLFRQAKAKAPCIVFIDEIDAVGRQRGAGIGGGNDEREQTLNQLLTEMDGFEDNSGVILLAATNRADVLDTALLRPGRFDRQIQVELPDRRGREAILGVHARTRPLGEDVSLALWARRTPGFSGADLANLVNEAAILTARRQRTAIDEQAMNDALERVTMGLAARPLQDSAKKRLIAYHEVGHALVGTLVKAHDPVQKVTLIPRGQAQGLTWFSPDEEQMLVSRAQLRARIMGALGGRAAEDVVFGHAEVTTGAGGDIQQVASIARQMVTRFGMSEVGQLSLEAGNQEVFLGRDLMTRSDGSDATAARVDLAVRQIVQNCYEETVKLVAENRACMDRVVDVLIEKESLDGDEFRALVGEFTAIPEKERFSPFISDGEVVSEAKAEAEAAQA